MKNNKSEKGITLIALIITIIVLLILAAISVGMLRTDNGILKQSRNAKNETIHSNVVEQLNIEAMNYAIDKTTDNTKKDLITYLKEDRHVLKEIDGETEKWQVDVNALLGSGQTMGIGNASVELKDVYILEVSTVTGMIENMKIASTKPFRVATKISVPKTYNVIYYGTSSVSGGAAVEGQRLEIGNVEDSEEIEVGLQPDGSFITQPGNNPTDGKTYAEGDYTVETLLSEDKLYTILSGNLVYRYNEDGSFFDLYDPESIIR